MRKEDNQEYLNYFNNGKPNWNKFKDYIIGTSLSLLIFYIGYLIIF